LGNVKEAVDLLEARESARIRGRHRARISFITTISTIVVALVAAGVFAVVQSITGPPSVTANSLASSIQHTTHVDFASCAQTEESTADWQCVLADLSGPRCSSGLLSASASHASRIELARSPSPDCTVTSEDAVEVEVNKESCYILELLAAIPLPSHEYLAPGQPPNGLKSPTASGCI
jgi:hypothetical protein